MKDTIIANTGNSRYLKSGIDADTTWAEFLQMLIAGTLPIDLNGLNAAGITQQGTLLNTANLLSSAACAALGLSQATAVPSDALVAIGGALTNKQNKAIRDVLLINVADWNGGTTCTKSVTGVTASNTVIVDSSNALVSCLGQGDGTLTFRATSIPTSATLVKVVIFP